MKENSFINSSNEKNRILDLQKRYEVGAVNEDGLTESEIDDLIKLYEEQIDFEEGDIQKKLKELDFYKEEILNIKNKIKK